MMQHIVSPAGVRLSFDKGGSGAPLVLVHGSFSDHHTNWPLVEPQLSEQFTVYAVARRGRGETDPTIGHSLEDEADDVSALIERADEPVFLLGHSYGAQVALAAAARLPHRIRKLILYEPPLPHTVGQDTLVRLDALAEAGDWDGFATTFFREGLDCPDEELDELRNSEGWAAIVSDAEASLGDIRAMCSYGFEATRFRELQIPVMLQVGSESPRNVFATDALAAVLPNVRTEELPGQAHEAMNTAPELYAESVTRFLLS